SALTDDSRATRSAPRPLDCATGAATAPPPIDGSSASSAGTTGASTGAGNSGTLTIDSRRSVSTVVAGLTTAASVAKCVYVIAPPAPTHATPPTSITFCH